MPRLKPAATHAATHSAETHLCRLLTHADTAGDRVLQHWRTDTTAHHTTTHADTAAVTATQAGSGCDFGKAGKRGVDAILQRTRRRIDSEQRVERIVRSPAMLRRQQMRPVSAFAADGAVPADIMTMFAAEHADARAVGSCLLPALRVRKRHESKDEQALLASSQRLPSVAPPHLVHPLFDGQHREPSRPQGRQAARGLIARMHIEVVGSSMEATHNINAQCAMYTRSDTCTMRNVHT